MENTGISLKTGEFVERKSKEEFFHDGEVIKELFEWTDSLIANEANLPCPIFTLSVFNQAYYICWLIIHEKVSVKRINVEFVFGNELERNHSWAVAYTLLRLNNKFYPLTGRIRMEFFKLLSGTFYSLKYANFVEGRNLVYPIDFQTSQSNANLQKPVDFIQIKSDIIVAMDNAIKLEEENKELRKQLEEERVKREEANCFIKALSEKLDAWENNSFYKAVNIQTIVDYVQDEDNNLDKKDVDSIKMILLGLCANKVPDKVIKKIRTLKPGGKLNFSVQHNTGCQNFYGPITDSEFPSK